MSVSRRVSHSIKVFTLIPPQGGLSSSLKKGFKIYVEAEDPDILVLTETKVINRLATLRVPVLDRTYVE